MSGIGRKNIFDFIIIIIMICALICLFRPQVRASQQGVEPPADNFSETQTPTVTPTPSTPRSAPPPPLPFIQPSDKMWIVQGEVYQSQDFFSCRITCRSTWQGISFEILQTTRGSEEWTPHQDEVVRCQTDSSGTIKKFISGGHWNTAPITPDETLCFLVIRQAQLRSSH